MQVKNAVCDPSCTHHFPSGKEQKGVPHLFIIHAWVGSLLLARVAQHGHDGPQGKVVVVLLGQLLHCQSVQGEHLLGQYLHNSHILNLTSVQGEHLGQHLHNSHTLSLTRVYRVNTLASTYTTVTLSV